MKIRLEQLSSTLEQHSTSLYWLSGDEILLLQEAADALRGHWREAGFEERQVFHVEQGFDWNDFHHELDSMSLFAERKLLELRLYSNKLDTAGKEALAAYLDRALEDFRVLVSSPRLESSTVSTKWFKQIESRSVLVQIWPIDRGRLPAWLRQRLAATGIHADDTALQILTDRVEGNLLAAQQEIEKLALLAGAGPGTAVALNGNTVAKLVSNSSRYDLGKLTDAALNGETARAQRVLSGLRAEGVFPLLILAVLSRELRQLLDMLAKIDSGQETGKVLAAARVWFSRKPIVTRALHRLSAGDVQEMLDACKTIDHAVKGLHPANPWDQLSMLVIRLSGHRVATSAPSTSD